MIPHRLGPIVLLLACAACAGQEAPAAQPEPVTTDVGGETAPAINRGPALSPLADSIAQSLVFLPRNQKWFTAAARGKRMLIDLGRVDVEVRKDSARAHAYREAVASRSPLALGSHLRLHGPWGADDVEIAGFDTWNGRIVAVLRAPAHVDALARRVEPLPAAARIAETETAATQTPVATPSCARDSIPPGYLERVLFVRDSLEQQLRLESVMPYDRLVPTITVKNTVAPGCFGEGRTIVVSSLRAGAYEVVREKIVMISDSGAVTPVRLVGSRWRAHEAIYAFDADGDGTDDLAVKGTSDRAGGMVIFKLIEGPRLEKLVGGFNWETR